MISVAVITLSDKGAAGERTDESGPAIAEVLKAIGGQVKLSDIIPDDLELIRQKLTEYSGNVDLIVTTGGTGLSPRDVTPEATLSVIERQIPGIAEAIRAAGLKKTPRAMLSRAVAGVLRGTLILNLPGSEKAVREGLDAVLEILPHAIDTIKGQAGDCAR